MSSETMMAAEAVFGTTFTATTDQIPADNLGFERPV